MRPTSPIPFHQDLLQAQNLSLLYPSHETFSPMRAVNPFIERFYRQRDNLANQSTTTSQQENLFEATRMYFLPGFLNHSPHPDFLRTLSHSAEHGLAFTSVSDEAHYFENSGYTVIGGIKKVYQPDWRKELATVVKRIYVDLMELQAKGADPERLILIGHSKGGLLAHSLAAYYKAEQMGDRARLHALFPGMAELPDDIVSHVLQALQGAHYLAIATPFDGLDDRTLRIARDYGFERVFANTADYYTTDFLEGHYKDLDLQPDDPDFGIHANITAQPFHEGSPYIRDFLNRAALRIRPNISSLFYYGGHTLFDLGALLLGTDLNHDALVAPPKRNFPATLHLKGHNHVTLVGPETGGQVIRFLQESINL